MITKIGLESDVGKEGAHVGIYGGHHLRMPTLIIRALW